MTRGKFQVNIDQTKCSSFSSIVTDLPTANVNLEYLKKRNMCVKLNQKGRLFLAWYSLSYWWPLLYCPVALLAVMRRFYFPNQVDSTASSQMRMLCKAFPTDLSEPVWEWGWNWTQVLPFPPPQTIRLYIKRRFFKYAISTGIVWYNFKLDFLIHREIWRLNRETVRWRPKPWSCWSSNSQIHKFFMSLSLQRFLFPATRARNLMSIRSAVEWFETMRI